MVYSFVKRESFSILKCDKCGSVEIKFLRQIFIFITSSHFHITLYRHKPSDSTSLRSNEILSLHEDKAGNLWVGTSGGSLSLYDRKKDRFINFPAGKVANSIDNNVIRGICSDYLGKIWIAHFTGINILDPVTKRVDRFSFSSDKSGAFTSKKCISVYEDSRHHMWIGTTEGLFRYQPENKSLMKFNHSSQNPASLSGNNINAITEDKRGNIWVGTNGGLSLMKPGSNNFINYQKSTNCSNNWKYKCRSSYNYSIDFIRFRNKYFFCAI